MSENLLQVQNAGKSFGARQLFENATFSVNAGEHIGVIGPNGAGKSTLFRMITGEETFDDGFLVRSRKLSMAYLSQHDHWEPEETGNSYLERVSRLPVWELKSRGRVLQLDEEILARPVLSLSGGYRMRIKILGLLGQEPNLMLLDEPTNYLDLETTLVLERFLQGYEGAFLLISHDREFLQRTTDHILEVEGGEVTKYNGNIEDYFEQKELLRSQLAARASALADKRKDILDFVARFGAKATKAKQAQSRLKQLAKMEAIELKPLYTGTTIRIPPPAKTGKLILAVEEASFGYGEKTVLRKVNLRVERGDHLAVLGLNGAGKSTLLKGITGTLAPQAGNFELGLGVQMGFFAQHVVEALNANDTVLSSMERAAHPDVKPQEILDLAGSLLFSGDDVRKSISVLSGGEKSRVALGRVLLQKAPCLVLDEPTNHLDFQTVEALTQALNAYEGTVITVSHDRSFVKRVGRKMLEVSKGGVRLYPGTYEEYVWSLQQDMAGADALPAPAPKAAAGVAMAAPKPANWKEEKKRLEKELRYTEKLLVDCEKEMARLEAESQRLNEELAAAAIPSRESVSAMAANGEKLQRLEATWLELAEEREKCQAAVAAMVGGI